MEEAIVEAVSRRLEISKRAIHVQTRVEREAGNEDGFVRLRFSRRNAREDGVLEREARSANCGYGAVSLQAEVFADLQSENCREFPSAELMSCGR